MYQGYILLGFLPIRTRPNLMHRCSHVENPLSVSWFTVPDKAHVEKTQQHIKQLICHERVLILGHVMIEIFGLRFNWGRGALKLFRGEGCMESLLPCLVSRWDVLEKKNMSRVKHDVALTPPRIRCLVPIANIREVGDSKPPQQNPIEAANEKCAHVLTNCRELVNNDVFGKELDLGQAAED